ncbi:hypothetical protein ESCO_001346 [Escovopsis weberi]|uniref:Uncharacterized protein n=1 Tax=Escovopsis weberi TaxID=150374 RepID=A0A0M9VTQ4_ESCWE|nr:hypothetical protein ESCO_001346 [Escovopsis weberi]
MESPSTNPPVQGTCTSSSLPGSETETDLSESSPSLSLSPGDDSDSSSIAVLSPPPSSPPHPPLRLATTTTTGTSSSSSSSFSFSFSSSNSTSASTSTSSSSTATATANLHLFSLDRKDGFFSLGSTSPPKHQSPLRQSVSSIDCPDLSLDGLPHKARFTTRPSRSRFAADPDKTSSDKASIYSLSDKSPEKAPERLLDRIRTSDLFPQSSSKQSAHNRRRSLFSPIEFKRSSTVEPDGWTTPSSTDKLSFQSPMRSTPFSFITSKMAGLKSFGSTPVSMPSNDELINLDIETALFPQGSPQQGESFTPAALMNLQITASGLLKKFQAAYQQQAMMIQELKAEKEAQDDEKAESDVRTRHLKIQLEDMARKASETETVMQALMEELNKEKRLRLEERRKSQAQSLVPSEGSIKTAKSDFSFETDEDSLEEASLFSRSRSPTLAPSIISEVGGGPAEQPVAPLALTKQQQATPQQQQQQPQQQQEKQEKQQPPVPTPIPRAPVRTSQPQMSAFQKLFKGISGDGEGFRIGGGCRNCQGQDASMAWDTVGLLRVENKGLKQRVGELESVVEEVLDVVNGVRLPSEECHAHA